MLLDVRSVSPVESHVEIKGPPNDNDSSVGSAAHANRHGDILLATENNNLFMEDDKPTSGVHVAKIGDRVRGGSIHISVSRRGIRNLLLIHHDSDAERHRGLRSAIRHKT